MNEAYRSKTYLSPLSAYGRQGGYGLTNIGIGLTDPSDRYTAKIWAKNLFDKRYAAAFSPATAVTPYIAVLGDPLSFGITVSVKAF